MRRAWFYLLLSLLQWTGCTMADSKIQGITLKADAAEFTVGGPIPVTIVYRNDTAAPVTFREPLKDWETQLRVTRGDATPQDRPFGRIETYTTPEGIERKVIEESDSLTLAPKRELVLAADLGACWPELFAPGVVRVRVIDLHNDGWRTQSNELTWTIRFTPDSVDRLLVVLTDAAASVDAHAFAARCFGALNASIRFEVERTDAAQINTPAAKNYRAWWDANRGSAAVAQRIAELNRRG